MEVDDRHFETRDLDARHANKVACRKLLLRLKEIHGKAGPEKVDPDIVDIVPAVVRHSPAPETKAEARFIRYLTDEAGRRIPTIQEIKYVVAEHFGITTTNIDSQSRQVKFCLPRQIGYYLSREMTLRSLPDIARRFGGRDHTSALSGIKKIERQLQADPAFAKTVNTLREKLA
jgi:chromosomal replication initiation ATPase DnaA